MLLSWLAPALAAGAIEVGVFRFRVPADWQLAPFAGQRAAAFEAPADADVARITFDRVYGVEAATMIASWPGLFDEPPAAAARNWTERVAGTRVHMAELSGTWRGGEGLDGTDQVMMAALFEGRRGLILVRMLVPRNGAAAAGPSFWKTVRGAVDAWQP